MKLVITKIIKEDGRPHIAMAFDLTKTTKEDLYNLCQALNEAEQMVAKRLEELEFKVDL
jgi:transcription initiation factor IIF auxiliary subunit